MKKPSSILLVEDDSAFRQVMSGELRRAGYLVDTAGSGEEALGFVAVRTPDIVLLDLRLPGMDGLDVLKALHSTRPSIEVVMLTGHGSIDTAIEAIRVGAFDYVVKPCPFDELQIRIERALESRSLKDRTRLLERGLSPPDLGSSFVGQSPEFRELLRLIERVAPSDSTVLITGETGTGKERVAKLIHSRSSRAQRPFVIVECAALQESLLQSELFGHVRGAFTGAERDKSGLFEVAHSGTIFLDEIGEVSPATQTKLLRVLDTATFRRVGGTSEVQVDVRILAATNRDLQAMVRQGAFREDLYYRLSTIRMELPPLRMRKSDVDLLAQHFISVLNDRFGCDKTISEAALTWLRSHDWPGNVRELLHAIEAAMIVCDSSEILPDHLPVSIRCEGRSAPAGAGTNHSKLCTLQEMERIQLRLALASTAGHRGAAAKILGISERSLYRKLQDHRLLNTAS